MEYSKEFRRFYVQETDFQLDIISYWRTYDKKEVDAVIGDAKIAIEIKSSEQVKSKHKAGLKAFYLLDFLRMLWGGELF